MLTAECRLPMKTRTSELTPTPLTPNPYFSLPLPGFAFLVHVLDAGFVDQQIGRAGAVHFKAVLVVPLDDAVDLFAVLQHQDHRRLGLHLLLIVEIFGVRLLRRRGLLAAVHGARALAPIAALSDFLARMIVAVESGTNQLAVGKHFGVESSAHGGGVHVIFHGVCSLWWFAHQPYGYRQLKREHNAGISQDSDLNCPGLLRCELGDTLPQPIPQNNQ